MQYRLGQTLNDTTHPFKWIHHPEYEIVTALEDALVRRTSHMQCNPLTFPNTCHIHKLFPWQERGFHISKSNDHHTCQRNEFESCLYFPIQEIKNTITKTNSKCIHFKNNKKCQSAVLNSCLCRFYKYVMSMHMYITYNFSTP